MEKRSRKASCTATPTRSLSTTSIPERTLSSDTRRESRPDSYFNQQCHPGVVNAYRVLVHALYLTRYHRNFLSRSDYPLALGSDGPGHFCSLGVFEPPIVFLDQDLKQPIRSREEIGFIWRPARRIPESSGSRIDLFVWESAVYLV